MRRRKLSDLSIDQLRAGLRWAERMLGPDSSTARAYLRALVIAQQRRPRPRREARCG